MGKVDLKKATYEDLKRSPELQEEVSRKYELDDYQPETYRDPNDNYNTKYVYTNFDDTLQINDVQNPNIKLLGEICQSEYKDWKVKPRSHDKTSIAKNLTKLQISLLVAEMFGYRHYQTERIIGLSQEQIKKELDIAIHKIVKLGIPKCKTCKWRCRGEHTTKNDFCKFWKIKIRNSSHCWLHKKG